MKILLDLLLVLLNFLENFEIYFVIKKRKVIVIVTVIVVLFFNLRQRANFNMIS